MCMTIFDDVVQFSHEVGHGSVFWSLVYGHMRWTGMDQCIVDGVKIERSFAEKMATFTKVTDYDLRIVSETRFAPVYSQDEPSSGTLEFENCYESVLDGFTISWHSKLVDGVGPLTMVKNIGGEVTHAMKHLSRLHARSGIQIVFGPDMKGRLADAMDLRLGALHLINPENRIISSFEPYKMMSSNLLPIWLCARPCPSRHWCVVSENAPSA